MKKRRFRFTTTRIILLGFLIGLLVGTVLLSLPISVREGQTVSFLDSMFVSTSAICVTGLSPVVTAVQWSTFGQVVLLLLIEFGGLSIVTVMTAMLLLLGRRVTLSDRMLIQEAYNLDTLSGLVRVTKSVVIGTLIAEGIGAFLYFFCFFPDYGWKSIWYAIFHSVSAFCNAGFDLVGEVGFTRYQTNVLMNVVTMLLIIAGGLGFPVWRDILQKGRQRAKESASTGKRSFRRMRLPRLSKLTIHSKLVLFCTLVFVLGGAALFFLFEYHNPKTCGELSFFDKLLTSLFQSVTTRTAGFQTIPQENLTEASSFLSLFLMFVGGSPSSTAGGVKTVTIAVIILSTISMIRGKNDIEVFHRRLPDFYLKKALSVVAVSIACVFVGTILICTTQGFTMREALYEVVSALATVGLSCGKTAQLDGIGKLIIIVCMYLGRVGPISMALSLQSKRKAEPFRYPEDKALIG